MGNGTLGVCVLSQVALRPCLGGLFIGAFSVSLFLSFNKCLVHYVGDLSDETLQRFARESPSKRGRCRLRFGGVRFHAISLMLGGLQWDPANT